MSWNRDTAVSHIRLRAGQLLIIDARSSPVQPLGLEALILAMKGMQKTMAVRSSGLVFMKFRLAQHYKLETSQLSSLILAGIRLVI